MKTSLLLLLFLGSCGQKPATKPSPRIEVGPVHWSDDAMKRAARIIWITDPIGGPDCEFEYLWNYSQNVKHNDPYLWKMMIFETLEEKAKAYLLAHDGNAPRLPPVKSCVSPDMHGQEREGEGFDFKLRNYKISGGNQE